MSVEQIGAILALGLIILVALVIGRVLVGDDDATRD